VLINLYKSQKQKQWANTPAGVAALGKEKVDYLNKISQGVNLPAQVRPTPNKPRISSRKAPNSHFTRVSWKGLK